VCDPALSQIIDAIRAGRLLGPSTFDGLDVDAALDQRDHDDSGWVQASSELGQPTRTIRESDIDAVRQLAYTATYESTTPHNPDLAAYVSEDFDLIVRSVLLGVESPWINGLLASYISSEFPRSTVVAEAPPVAVQVAALQT
jgi:hypothetical protein